jgi:hypothetical protein
MLDGRDLSPAGTGSTVPASKRAVDDIEQEQPQLFFRRPAPMIPA